MRISNQETQFTGKIHVVNFTLEKPVARLNVVWVTNVFSLYPWVADKESHVARELGQPRGCASVVPQQKSESFGARLVQRLSKIMNWIWKHYNMKLKTFVKTAYTGLAAVPADHGA